VTLLAQVSDLHVRVGPDEAARADRVAAVVEELLALDPLPDAVLLSGDLGDAPSDAEYERVGELLAPLPMPVHVLTGNHDDREAVRARFGAPGRRGEPLRYVATAGGLRLVACDTTLPGRGDGALGRDGLAWLEARLAEDPATPTVVAMHHAPLLTGVAAMDEFRLDDGDRRALAALLERSGHVLRVLAGHVHRTAVAQLGGVPVFACPAVSGQLRLDFRATRLADLEFTGEPPGFALHRLARGELTTHVLTAAATPRAAAP
jgi:Icc protein